MRIIIDQTGAHDAPDLAGSPSHMVVDRDSCLVDLSNAGGVLRDPSVIKVEWGPFLEGGRECGRLYRRMPGATIASVEMFGDRNMLAGYVLAFRARLADIEAKTRDHHAEQARLAEANLQAALDAMFVEAEAEEEARNVAAAAAAEAEAPTAP